MQRITLGWILATTLDLTRKHISALAVFAIGLAAVATGLDLLAAADSLRIGELIGGFVAGYYLLQHIMGKEGMLAASSPKPRLMSFFGVIILSTIGAVFGFLIFILPGLILLSRWSIAYSLVVSDGMPVMAAMRESWERTRGSQWSIVGFYAVYILVIVGSILGLAVMLGGVEEASAYDTAAMAKTGFMGLAGSFAINVVSQFLTGVGYFVAVAIQKGVRPGNEQIRAIFS